MGNPVTWGLRYTMRRAKYAVICVLVALFSFLGYDTASADTDHPINDPATGLMVATRMNPPPPPAPVPVLWTTESANGKCVGLIDALTYWSPGWDVNRMAGIAYRESRCDPNAANSCCTGVLQIHAIWIPKAAMCGVYSRADLKDPWKNICAASIVWRDQGIGAWSTA